MQFTKDSRLSALSGAEFFSRYHHYLIAFVISTFLAGFMSEIALGWVLAAASAVTALSLTVMPKIFDRSGTRRVLVVFGLLEISIVIGLSLAGNGLIAGILFALQGMCAYNMFLGLDILLEAHTIDETKTGRARGIFLVLANVSVLLASLSLAFILTDHNYQDVFLIAAAALVPFTLLAASLPSISRVTGAHTSFRHTLREIWRRTSLLPTMAAHLLLLVYFAWSTYYVPLYLYDHIGFSWQIIGIIFAASLVPYVVLEYPVGVFADTRYGEKEFALAGFIIMAGGFAFFSLLQGTALIPWIAVVLITDIGAAMVEISTEAHFFKQVSPTDPDLIGAFRMLRPLSAIAAPLIASVTLLFVPFHSIFIVFGLILLFGVPFVMAMTDTR